MNDVYVQVFIRHHENEERTCHVPLESVITLYTYLYCHSNINLNFVKCYNDNETSPCFEIKLFNFKFNWIDEDNLPLIAKSCFLPIVIINSNTVIAGLCSVSREIVKLSKNSSGQEDVTELLGFRRACLMSPNETSIWTKFCEIDITNTLKSIISNKFDNGVFNIPVDIARFECHLSQPIRAHNISKLSQKINGKKTQNNSEQLEHKFAEGIQLTLSDIILFPCFYIIFKYIRQDKLIMKVPLTIKWYKHLLLEGNGKLSNTISFLSLIQKNFEPKEVIFPVIENHSLYKSDPKRYKPRSKIYTKQVDIEKVLHTLKNVSLDIKIPDNVPTLDNEFNWNTLPFDALPEGGNLPEKRRLRKGQQLESLAKVIIKLAVPGDHIIDFCSGSGHLGIIIASMLPQCHISLLENKEESMNRAKLRVLKLGLNNVSFYQCNLDFFKADFQIGVSLHACGVATDLVIRHCIERNASFVCCPCCYGSVHNCHHLTYPRSKIFQEHIELQDYLVLGHGADQTHDVDNHKTSQGEMCMDFIDKDRIMWAQECGYDVLLRKLHPPTCTPKNNLLIGLNTKHFY